MNKALFLLVVSLAASAAALTLPEAVEAGLNQNRNLQSIYKKTMAETQRVFVQQGAFDWSWFVKAYTSREETPTSSQLQGTNAASASVTTNTAASAGIKKIIENGSSLQLEFNLSRQKTNSSFSFFNPIFGSDLALEYTLPLLKNRGSIARVPLRLQENVRDLAFLKLLQSSAELTLAVQNAYLDAVLAHQNIALQSEELTLARKFLEDTQARIDAGLLSSKEIFAAQARLASARKNLTQAKSAYATALDTLRTYMPEASLEPLALPEPIPEKSFNEEELVQQAMQNRMEIDVALRQIEQAKLLLVKAKNEQKLELDFNFMFGVNGVKGSYHKSVKDTLGTDFLKWQFGLQLAHPFVNRKGEKSVVAALHEVEEAKLKLEQAKLSIAQEVRESLRQYETAKAIFKEALAQEENLASLAHTEEEKLHVGLSTPFLVQQANKDYLAARLGSLQGRISIFRAYYALEKAIGLRREKFQKKLAAALHP